MTSHTRDLRRLMAARYLLVIMLTLTVAGARVAATCGNYPTWCPTGYCFDYCGCVLPGESWVAECSSCGPFGGWMTYQYVNESGYNDPAPPGYYCPAPWWCYLGIIAACTIEA